MSVEYLFCNKINKLCFRSISNRNFGVLPFEYFPNRVLGTCQTRYHYYWPRLLTVLQMSVATSTNCYRARNPLQTITVLQSDLNVNALSLISMTLFTMSTPNDLPTSLLKYCTIVWIILCICYEAANDLLDSQIKLRQSSHLNCLSQRHWVRILYV
jgi:hypothetical protein